MKIFIDSADIDEIAQAYSWGIVDGVTTNPSLLKAAVDKRKAKGETLDMEAYITKLLEISKPNPVSLEVTKRTAKEMIAQGRTIYKRFNSIAKNVNIKIPVNPAMQPDEQCHFDGINAVKVLQSEGIPVNCTLVFTPEQALLAAKAGAVYISPFAGRIDDYIRSSAHIKFDKSDYFPEEGIEQNGVLLHDNGIVSGIDVVSQCFEIVTYYEYKSEIIAASLRNPRQVREAALAGAHIATVPFGVIAQMLRHEKTFEGMKKFTDDIVPEYEKLIG